MQVNRIKAALTRGEVMVGACVMYERNPVIAQIYAASGLDFMYVDMEHSSISMEHVADMVLAAKAAGIVPLIGPTAIESYHLTRPLDSGAMGVIVPHVDTREQVECIVRHVKYPPQGQRGLNSRGPHTDFDAMIPAAEVMRFLNAETLVVLKIESVEAIDHLEDLLSVPGVDACMVGPGDLSVSVGVPGQYQHPKEQAHIETLVQKCRKCGVASGIHLGDVAWAKHWMDRGMTFIAYSSESGILQQALSGIVSDLRTHAGAV
jgi:2-keto-3-deoxy-L-rhamnonate aldolase RhmA